MASSPWEVENVAECNYSMDVVEKWDKTGKMSAWGSAALAALHLPQYDSF